MIIDQFDEMIEQSKAQPLVMGIALHPYLVGQPYRLRHLRSALTHIVNSSAAWITTPGAIASHVSTLEGTRLSTLGWGEGSRGNLFLRPQSIRSAVAC
jgi:allantoinase